MLSALSMYLIIKGSGTFPGTLCGTMANIAAVSEQARRAGITEPYVQADLVPMISADNRAAASATIRAIYATTPIPPLDAGVAALKVCKDQIDD